MTVASFYLPVAEILDNVEHSGHLTEDQNLVFSFKQSCQHLIQHFHFATDLYEILVDAIEHSAFGQRVLQQVGVVRGLPHVH